MRILHVIYKIDPQGGGPPRALAGLAPAQKRAGLDVRVLASCRRGADMRLKDQLEAQGIPVQTVGPTLPPIAWHPSSPAIARRMVAEADVVHIHAIWEDVLHQAARAAAQKNVPYIFRPCGMLDPWSLSQSPWRKRLYLAWRLRHDLNHAAALHFTCETERQLTEPLQLKSPGLVESNGVDLAEFESLPQPGAFRRRHPHLADRPLALFLSRIHHKKGLDLLVPAFARCAVDDAMLVIAGPDPTGYRADVERLARVHGVEDRVLFTGMLNGADRIEALADADLFILPSYQENFGVAVVEALAAGTPVLISDQVNIYREIVDAGAGAAVPTQVEPLAEQMGVWLRDADRRNAAAARARPFVWEHYDWNRIARRWVDHYRALVQR